MVARADYEVVDRTPNKTVVDQGLAILLPPFAEAVARVLVKEYGDGWWAEVEGMKAKKNSPEKGKLMRYLNDPPSDSFGDRVGVLQVSNCCEIVFAHRLLYKNAWGDAHIGLTSLVLEARNRASHRAAGEADLSPEDAEYYLYAMLRLARAIRADPQVCEALERVHEVLWTGGSLGYRPVVYRCQGEEPSVSEVLAVEAPQPGAGGGAAQAVPRWFDDDARRALVRREMEGLGQEDVEREVCERLASEVDVMEARMSALICLFPRPASEVSDRPDLTFVVLPPADGEVTADSCTAAEAQADEALATCGGERRRHRNALVFVFSETVRYRLLERSAAEYLALRRLAERGPDGAALSGFVAEADLDVRRRLRAAFSNVLVPEGPWERHGRGYRRLGTGGGNVFDGAVDALVRSGLLYLREERQGRTPRRLSMSAFGFPDSLRGGCVRISDFWDAVSSDCRMPRFESRDVLLNAVWRDVRDGRYCYLPPEAEWRGAGADPRDMLVIGEELPGVSMDGYVVAPDVAFGNVWAPSGGWYEPPSYGSVRIPEEAGRRERRRGPPDRPGAFGQPLRRRGPRSPGVAQAGRRRRDEEGAQGGARRGSVRAAAEEEDQEHPPPRGPRQPGRLVRPPERRQLLLPGLRARPDGGVRRPLEEGRHSAGQHHQGRRGRPEGAGEAGRQARRVGEGRPAEDGRDVLPGDHGPLLRVDRRRARARGRDQGAEEGPDAGQRARGQGARARAPAGPRGARGPREGVVHGRGAEGGGLGRRGEDRPGRGRRGDPGAPGGRGRRALVARQGAGRGFPGGGSRRGRGDPGDRAVRGRRLQGGDGHRDRRHGPRHGDNPQRPGGPAQVPQLRGVRDGQPSRPRPAGGGREGLSGSFGAPLRLGRRGPRPGARGLR